MVLSVREFAFLHPDQTAHARSTAAVRTACWGTCGRTSGGDSGASVHWLGGHGLGGELGSHGHDRDLRGRHGDLHLLNRSCHCHRSRLLKRNDNNNNNNEDENCV